MLEVIVIDHSLKCRFSLDYVTVLEHQIHSCHSWQANRWLLQEFNFDQILCLELRNVRILIFPPPWLVLLHNHKLWPVRMTDENKLLVDWFLEKVHFVSTKQKLNKCLFFFFGQYYVFFLEKQAYFPAVFLCSLTWWWRFVKSCFNANPYVKLLRCYLKG